VSDNGFYKLKNITRNLVTNMVA